MHQLTPDSFIRPSTPPTLNKVYINYVRLSINLKLSACNKYINNLYDSTISTSFNQPPASLLSSNKTS